MAAIETTGSKRLVLVSGRAHPNCAEQIAEELGAELVPTDARTFANGEIYARYDESVRGSDAFVIQSHTAPINEWLMEQLIMIDALKRASAKRITVVAPFYPYARLERDAVDGVHHWSRAAAAALQEAAAKREELHEIACLEQWHRSGPVPSPAATVRRRRLARPGREPSRCFV